MINRFSLTILCVMLVAASAGLAKTKPDDVHAEMLAMAKTTDIWPGLDIAKMPVAIFDGNKTWLFQHPKPPKPFSKVSDHVYAMDGRHEAMDRSGAAMLAGVGTATLLNETLFMSKTNGARVALQNALKAHRLQHHPHWKVDESVRFSYPDGSPALIQARRMEHISLWNALNAGTDEDRNCWINSALFVRKGRAKRMTEADIKFERMLELTEGLDLHLKHKMEKTTLNLGELGTAPPDFYRDHAVLAGAAWAFLLDATSKDWRNQLEQNDKLSLEDLLTKAVPKKEGCSFNAGQRQEMFQAAKIDSMYMRRQRVKQGKEFDQRAGWRVFVKTLSQPLKVNGYDATKVNMIDNKTVLHKRYLAAKSDSGSLKMENLEALSLSAGKHALFDGLDSVRVFGLQGRPEVTEKNGVIEVKGEGIKLSFKNADAAWDDKELRIVIN